MKPKLTAISGCGSKGPACFLVETNEARMLLDLGYGPDPGDKPDVSQVGRIDAVLLSHGHPDHAGSLDLLDAIGNPPVYASDIVLRGLRANAELRTLPLAGTTELCGVRVTTGRNGHAPGGVWLCLDVGDGLLYMGDNCTESLLYAFDMPPHAATVIVDASYGVYDGSLDECAKAFDDVFASGATLLPVPGAGRGPEMALHAFRTRGELPFVDDAIREALQRLLSETRGSARDDVADDLAVLARDAPAIDGARGVMLAGRGDADAGEAARLVNQWENEAAPQIIFSGYLTPGTPASRLTKSGRARYMRWNVHPRLSDNVKLARESQARIVLPAFGDARHLVKWEEAFAPARVKLGGTTPL